ncbi:MAG: sodium:solute symporter, partial [Pseudomonadota bacterium]|nr:sodium:solute symporter [Pseudomonadota bacterium]
MSEIHFELQTIDLVIIALYAVFIIVVGLVLAKKHKNAEEYFLAGRGMIWPLVGISLFASNMSSTTLIGLPGSAYQSSIAAYNYEWMAIIVLVIFAIFFLPFYLQARIYTIPEFLEKRFDKRARYYFSLMTLFLNVVVDTAGALYAGGLVMELIFPAIPLWQNIVLLAVMAGIYTIAGGLSAVIITDTLQALLLLIGSVIITLLALSEVGGWHQVVAQIPPADLSLIRPIDDPDVPWPGLISGVFIVGFYFWATNQFITQRVLSAKNVNHGRWGVLLAGLLKIPVLFIMVLPGLMGRVLYPDLDNPDSVYPTLLFDLLPVGLLGLVIAGLIAALMSSIDSTLNSASTLVTMDFVHHFKPNLDNRQLMWIGRFVTFLFMLFAVIWAPQIRAFEGLFQYLQQMLAYAVSPVVAIFALGLFWWRANATGAFFALMVGLITGSSLFIINEVLLWTHIHFLYISPILFGLSLITAILVSLITQPPKRESVENYTWNKAFFDRETQEVKRLPWYQNYRILSILLLI